MWKARRPASSGSTQQPLRCLLPTRLATRVGISLRVPGYASVDFALYKNFVIREGKDRIQFRSEFFNIFNRTNFNNPGTFVRDSWIWSHYRN